MVLAHPRLKDFDLSSLRYLLYGAATMSVDKLREACDVFGPTMTQRYGTTARLLFITVLTPNNQEENVTTTYVQHSLASARRSGPSSQPEVVTAAGKIPPEHD